jgi:uncharacterized protein
MPNHLAQETSPYLLQHADQPVDWHPWNDQALAQARQEDKPIFLSIGYAACHWCHVMAHETFDDPKIARFLNEHFISIKVDREERPDLDGVYMSAVVAMTGQGGWPMSVFLTPEGRPFYGGTYFPPQPRHGMPSFRQVIESIYRSWVEERQRVDQIGEQMAEAIHQNSQASLPERNLVRSTLQDATAALTASFDAQTGGWGRAPKFPQPMAIDFLLAQATRGDKTALQVALRSLDKMMAGGMHDLVGGGFHRYSTDADWLVPHFEKMLYDNAQLALAYLHGYQLTGNAAYRKVCEGTLDFINRELTHPDGGFYSSLDADSPGGEGHFYTWSADEVAQAIMDDDLRALALRAYGITPAGNFDGRTILRLKLPPDELAAQEQLDSEGLRKRLDVIRKSMFTTRQARPRPATDDKVITAWNALALRAFAEAGAVLNNPTYTQMAMRNARFLLDRLTFSGRLHRSWRGVLAHQPAFLEDYAALILGLLGLYQADPQVEWFSSAGKLLAEMIDRFADPQGGFFDTASDQPSPLARPKELQDNATPSGNALAALALLKMAELTGSTDLSERAVRMVGPLQEALVHYATSFALWLQALDFSIGPVLQVAILGNPAQPDTQSLLSAYTEKYRPRTVLAVSSDPPAQNAPALLQDRHAIDGRPTAYVCEGFRCLLPATDLNIFRQQLELGQENRPAPR